MNNVTVGDPMRLGPGLLDRMFRLRHSVFKERLKWDVQSFGERERDIYDDLNPVYIVASRPGVRPVEGCWRFLPTTGPYMLKNTFSILLRGETPPSAPGIWEVSRFAIAPAGRHDCKQADLSSISLDIMRAAVAFAEDNGIHTFVGATSVALVRLLSGIGIPIYRFGDGEAIRIGNVLSVAFRIPINDDVRTAIQYERNLDFAPDQTKRVA